jgi:tetratricopeptide (TPR) repeat protein
MGTFQELSGDADGAKVNYTKSLALTEALLLQQPENVSLLSDRATLHASLGNKQLALQDADRAIANLPISKDALEGPRYEELRARILAYFGDKDEAITILQRLLLIAGVSFYQAPLTPAFLRLDPAWDNLRGDPRFEKLCQEPAK